MNDTNLSPFAQALFEPDDIVEIRCLPSKRSTWRKASELASFDPPLEQNVYIGANPRSNIGGTDAESVALFRCLFADIDGVTLDEGVARVRATTLPAPSAVVFTGGGVHVYWRLEAPLTEAVLWTAHQKAIIVLLQSDKVIHDPPRIMRLPGTRNHKRGVDSQLIEVHPDRRYGIGAFPQPAAESPPSPQPSSDESKSKGNEQLSRATLLFVHHGASEGERNARLFSAACDYAGCGLSQDQAEKELGDAARRCGLDDREIRDAIASAYSKSRSPARPSPATVRALPVASAPAPQFEYSAGAFGIACKPSGERGRAIATVWHQGKPIFTDDIKVQSSHSRAQFIKKAEKHFPGLDPESVESMLVAKAVEFETQPDSENGRSTPARDELLKELDEQNRRVIDGTPPEAIAEAEELLRDPKLIDRIIADIAAVGVVGERGLALTSYAVGTSRKLTKPLSTITQGPTSSGKSYVLERVAGMMPPEEVLIATDITTQALYYLDPGALIHRYVVAGERSRKEDDDHAEATRALREMLASGQLSKLVPSKGPDGKMRTVRLWQPGPIAFSETTTRSQIFDEDANRCLLLGTDESPEQTERIVLAQAERASSVRPDISPILTVHHALQRLLRRCEVQIPFAMDIGRAIPKNRQEARRAMPQVLAMISTVALLHQRQRRAGVLEHGDVIIATQADYVIARQLLLGPMARSLGGGLPGAVERFGHRVIELFPSVEFTSTEVLLKNGLLSSKGKVNEYLNTLAEAGVTDCLEPSKGKKPAIWKVIGDVPVAGELWLPTLDQIRGGGQ